MPCIFFNFFFLLLLNLKHLKIMISCTKLTRWKKEKKKKIFMYDFRKQWHLYLEHLSILIKRSLKVIHFQIWHIYRRNDPWEIHAICHFRMCIFFSCPGRFWIRFTNILCTRPKIDKTRDDFILCNPSSTKNRSKPSRLR